jgi:hypothetical protein
MLPVFPVVVERGLSYFDGTMQIHKSLKIDKKNAGFMVRVFFENLTVT